MQDRLRRLPSPEIRASAHMGRMLTLPRRDPAAHALRMFLVNTAENQMEVLLDQGLYRHLRFKKPGTSLYSYEITTTPWQLAVRGDMASYMFVCAEDMFDFFSHFGTDINPGYWAEKLRAQDVHSPARGYSREKFVGEVLRLFWACRARLEDPAGVWAEVRRQVLDNEWGELEDRNTAITAACRFHHGGFDLSDAVHWDLDEFSHQYLYCLHAIVRAVAAYRAASPAGAAAPAAV